jgi:hypothetical protein
VEEEEEEEEEEKEEEEEVRRRKPLRTVAMTQKRAKMPLTTT